MSSIDERYEEWKKKKNARPVEGSDGSSTQTASVDDRYKAWLAQRIDLEGIASSIADRTSTWLRNHNNYLSNYNNRYSGRKGTYEDSYVADAGDWAYTASQQKRNFEKEAQNIMSMLDRYGDYLDKDWAKSIRRTLQKASLQQGKIADMATGDAQFWRQFASEDEYGMWQADQGYRSKYAGKSYDEIVAAIDELDDSNEKDWLSSHKYGLLSTAEDFADKSKYVSTYRGGEKFNSLAGIYTDTGFDDISYDYINRNETARNRQALSDIQSNASLLGLDNSERGEMTDEEISIFNYLYATKGSDTAYAYIDYLTSDLNARQRASEEAKWAEYAKKDPFGSSVFSILESPMKGLSYIGQAADYFSDGTIDQNAGYNKFSYINSSIRNEVSAQVEKKWGGVGSFAYQTGMSMGDFLFTTAVSGGNQALSLAIMGTGAAADTTIAAKDRGLSDDQAFALGTVAGVAEVAMEKIGLDALFNVDLLNASAVKYIFNNAIAEGFEEVGTDVINTVADILISQDKSQWQAVINAYMSEGKTEAEAFALALGDKALELGLSFAGGAVSGGVIGGGGATINAGVNAHNAKQTYGNYAGELVGEALEIDPGNTFAQKMQGRLDSGKKLSGGQLNRLVQQNERTLTAQDLSSIQSAATQRLTELGETGDVDAIAAALTKRFSGQKLTHKESQLIQNSQYGRRVSTEMNPENIRNGGYSSEWAENIGTHRINAQEYGRMLQAAQQAQETAETTGGQVVAETQNEAQQGQATTVEEAEAPVATVQGNRTVDTKTESTPVAIDQNTLQVAEEISEAPEAEEVSSVTLEDASKKYGAQAGAMMHTYQEGQDVAKFDKAYQAAYDMGRSGVALSYVAKSETASYLTDAQKELAYEAGKAAADAKAIAKDAQNKAAANGKTGWKKGGVVRGEGVTISDLKKAFNDHRGKAYKVLSTIAKVTGINIVLYKSGTDADGNFVGAQGAFDSSNPNELRIDINAGLENISDVGELEKYVLLRTFSHEFTHFIEKWNPIQYNEFRRVVFDTMTQRGNDVNRLIELQQEKNPGMGYEAASREVVAEAMTDILPDSSFVQTLAQEHKTIFNKLLEKLKEFVKNLREYFDSIGYNEDLGANALKEDIGGAIKYVDSIVKLFDQVAVRAVENYQKTVATDEVVVSKKENTTEGTTTISTTETVEAKPKAKKSTKKSKPIRTKKSDWPSADVQWTLPSDVKHPIAYSTRATSDSIGVMADEYPTDTIKELQEKFTYGPDEKKVLQQYIDAGYGNQIASEWFSYDKKFGNTRPTTRWTNGVVENEEVTNNGENADNQGAVRQPESDGRGAAPVLDELQAEDVPGDGSRGDAVGSSAERGPEAGRDGDRPDTQRPVGGSGEGSGQSRDLRPDGERNGRDRGDGRGSAQSGEVQPVPGDSAPGGRGLNAEDATDNNVGGKLHEEVVEQISQQSTEQPKGRNFVIGDSLDLPSGEKSRYKANVEAIRLVKKLEAEGRYATEAEQAILSKYVGWGGLANAFDQHKADWAKEFQELKELLTEEEYTSARGSTLNAHYTDISVIKAMYDGLKQLGFTGGRMMEPSSGVGNFVGAMPADMAASVRSWTMVELDGITGMMAKYLYPNADVRIQGFEKANIPNNFMDVAIGNVPFGNYAIADKNYPKKVTSAIHNYFFAKSLDKVRPGGIVMFITSSYTMNSSDSTVRRYIMQHADLLGAIRLPDNAFKGNAGTEVVTDILVLKKRAANTNYAGENFLEAPYQHVDGFYSGAYINKYFLDHPEMVLGKATMTGGMYRSDSLTYKALEGKGSLADQIREAFKNIQGKMDYPAQTSPERTNFAVERAGKKTKENGLIVKEGKVYQNQNGELVEQTVAKGAVDRISGMLEIRDAAKALQNAQQQGLKETEVKKARQKLNKIYDDFVKKHGFINAQANKNAIMADPDRYSILALENWNPDTKKATKADIFTKNTIAANRTVTSAKDVAEGLIVSINQTGGVDTALIAKLTGKTVETVTRELIDSRQVFKNRDGKLETAEVYLSGNVRAKLRDAEALVSLDADYQKNVEALKDVMPEDVGYQDIFVNPGTPWIPDSVYSDFAAHMLGGRNTDWRKDVVVTRNKDTGNFTVDLGSKYLKTNFNNTQKWGTNRRSFLDLFDAMLNSKSVVVKYKDADGKSVVDRDATAAANEKIENIQKEFQEWLWQDEARRAELATLYNEVFNSIVTPKYNGDNLTVNGANAMKPLRPHQRNAVQRIIASGGNTLLAHKVGAGKTYEMAAAAMKLKQLGLVKKPMFAVPKSLVAQWGNEFMDFFPTAKLLVAEAGDFTAANRKIFMNRIANGDYDAVIVSYEQFERLPVSNDFTRELYQEQIESVIRAIEEAKAEKGGKSLSVKDLEKKRKSLQTKIEKLTDSAKDEGNIDFEQLGVDSIFVDEAHNFKNLFYTTSMTNVSGLGNKDGSKRAFDLYTKVRYLQKLNGGRGIVFATATPVMNSMSEMYIMQKYLQPDLLDQLGLSTFDAWAKQFGEVVNGVEIKPSGQGYRVKQSFSRFKNMSELQLLFRNFADVLTDIPGLKIPKMKGGKVNVVVCEPGQFQQDYMKELEQRADNIKNVDPSIDNMLKITSDGRKISYTQRMIDPSLPYEEGCKIYRCADNVLSKYQESKENKGTQIIFCDMATPKGKSNTAATETEEIETDMESAKLYDDIKARLVKGGIPGKEIAFIHEADTDIKKKKLFADVNDGKVRVLIGSTGKMGVGMNAQKRIVAIHHLDAPWRPGDVEQRNGRAYRQGNINEEVENFTYVTEGSFDARLWDILERKQNFINQVMNGENVGRETEDTGEVTLSAAEVKALASGSPLIMEQVQLDTDIKKLESLYRAHRSAVTQAKQKLEADRGAIETLQKRIDNGEKDVAARVDTYSEGKFSITVGKQKFTDKKDAGVALMAEATAKANEAGYTTIGKFAGFELRVVKTHEGIKGLISGNQGYSFNTYPGNTTYMISHLIAKVEGMEENVKLWKHNLAETRKDMAEQEKLIDQPFDKQAELDQKRARYNEVMEILNPKEEQTLDSMDEDTVQYQRRRSDRADRRRALAKGEMVNEFYNALTAAEWHAYYDKIIDGKYNPELFEDDDLATVTVNDKVLLVKMKSNGEFSVSGVWKYQDTLPPEDVIKEMMNKYATSNYGENEIVSWLSRLVGYDGQKIFFPYNRHSGQYDGIAQQSAASSKNAAGMSAQTWGNGEGVLAVPAGESDGGDYTQNQQRTNTLTNREVLALAASELQTADLNAAERDALGIFQQRLAKLETLQEERTELGRLYKEQQFGTKVDRAAAEQTRNRMKILDDQIEKAKAEVLSIEDKQVLKQVLQKARKVVEKQQWIKDEEKLKRYRDRRNNADAIKKYRGRLQKDVNDLTNWVLHPNNKDVVKHIPDVLKNSVIPFLGSIDFTSKQQLRGGAATKADQEFMKRLNGLKAALKPNQSVDGLYADYSDLPPNFMDRLQMLIDSAQAIVEKKSGEFVVNEMTSDELRELSQVVRTLKEYIKNFNKFHANAMFQHVHEAGDNTISDLGQMSNASDKTGSISNFVMWQQIRPAYAWERFGEGGKAIYDGLRRGQAKLAFNTKTIVEFSEKAYTEAEVQAWEKDIKSINLGNDIVKMPVSTIMSFYELSKRPQALGHILGQGIRVATYKANGKKVSDTGHTVTPGDVETIISTLTDRQKEVADNLQKFMQEQGGKWGNYVSVKRFGEELFGEDHYFPINSDGRHLAANAEEHPSAASLYALLNMGFTKSTTEGANNRLVLYSIFDVFANHMASMAQYNAFALPVVDAIKWFNYQQKSEPDSDGKRLVLGSVRDQMDRVYGVPEETRPGSGKQGYAQSFVINILKAFNGTEAQGVPTDTTGLNALRQYNMAQVAFNLRVVAQQPLAITRAALLVDYGSIIKGMKLNPAAIRQNIQEMQRYSGIAAWKGLGFYDVNISRGLTDIIKHSSTVRDKISEVGMWGAEKADLMTWAGIWSACKEEVIKKQRLTPESDGFYDAVTQLFEEVIYKTQVVDSVLTKNEYLRSKGFFARAIGSFMSEPTTTASMLIDAYDKYHADMQRGMNRQQAWKKNSKMIVRTAYVYGLSAVVLAAVQAVADAFRDDDDYQEWYEKWLEAFGGNLVDELMPVNKLPILSDFYEVAKELLSIVGVDTYGNAPTSVFMQWYDSLVKGVEILHDKIKGEDTNYTWYGGAYKLLQATSGITGLPMAAATREIITAWNNTVGAMAPSLKVKTYDSGEMNEIKYAYQDGWLTYDEAMEQLLQQGLVDNEDEAYWTMQGWEVGDGYSKYDAIYEVVLNGGDFEAAMADLTAHGHKEKDVISQVKSQIGKWYYDDESSIRITKQQAIDMLTKYTDMDSEEITATVNKWSSKVVTGIAFNDIKDEFLNGNITESRAIEMYVRYGGYTQEDAAKTVTKWRAEKEIGIAYDDIDDAFLDGEISDADARNMYITYGGYTEEDAQEQVYALAFEKEHPSCEAISYAAVTGYEKYCESAGVTADVFYDVWKYSNSVKADVDASGKTISGSKKKKAREYILSLDLSSREKQALLNWLNNRQ